MSAFQHCCLGKIAEGTPKGSFTQLGGMQTYVVGEKTGRALLYVPDAFGLGADNSKLLADYVAKEAQVTVYIPDCFYGDPVPASLLSNLEEIKKFDFVPWIGRHNKAKVYPDIVAAAKELKEKHGVTFLAGLGVCYGGWAVAQLSRDKLIDGVIFAHPSLMQFPEDVENLNTPSLWLCAETDQQFPRDKRQLSEEILGKKHDQVSKFVLYPGTEHGFLVRGNAKEPHIKQAAEDAAAQVVLFLLKYTTA